MLHDKKTSSRITFIDGLRGVAAFSVMLPHNRGLFALLGDNWVRTLFDHLGEIGARGVQIFFVLSGFVIAASIGKNVVDAKYFLNFVLRRMLRLDPPYWVAIGIAVSVEGLKALMGIHASFPSWTDVLAHVFYVAGFLHVPWINDIFWTLAIEVQFYLIFCAIIGVTQFLERRLRRPLLVPVVLPGLFLASLLFMAGSLFPMPDFVFLAHWPLFLLGALLWHGANGAISRASTAAGCSLLLILGLIVASKIAIAGALTGFLIWLAIDRDKLFVWLSGRKIQFLGRISYSLYLVHVPVALVVLPIYVRVPWKSAGVSLAFLALSMCLSIAVAWMLYLLVEAPSARFSKKFRASPN